jgi:5-bromo-4-chloroindolyl phosphate hydrolysis protein
MSDSIRVKCEFDSNLIDESDLQDENILIQEFQHSLESKLIEVMKSKMLSIQFESDVNLIQM